MTDLQILMPDQELILETAVDRDKAILSNLTDTAILDVEMQKPAILTGQMASIKSTEILQPSNIQPESEPKTETSSAIATQGVLESIVAPIQNFINNISNKTTNFLTSGFEKVTESEKITRDGITEILNNSEKSYTNSLEASIRQTDSLIEKNQSVVKEITSSAVLEKESSQSTFDKLAQLINSSEVSSSTILQKAVESKDADKKPSDLMSSTDSGLLQLFKDRETELNQISETNSATTKSKESSVTLKSNKLVESSEVKNLVTPDKTLEKSVTVLSQALPEAVNNLSTSVTSISPSTINNNSTVNEGTKIDQSSSTVINRGSAQAPQPDQSTNPNQPQAAQTQNNEYYLQAIYAALMSGKIKVKLETY